MEAELQNEMNAFFESEDFNGECKKQFDSYDNDASGYLEKSEVTTVLKELVAILPTEKGKSLEVTDKDVEDAMADLDTNADGKLSLDEFKNFAKMIFMAALGLALQGSA